MTLHAIAAAALVALGLCARITRADGRAALGETRAAHDARMAWWRDARFGMFIHWGVYSVPAGVWQGKTGYAEWFLEETHIPVSQYQKFADRFDPEKFDAARWVAIAKGAGMKYIVITSKHHDGFCMWPTKMTDWCVSRTPFGQAGRDPLKELSQACRAAGIRFGVYYSIMDWHHSDWLTRRAWNDVATGKPDMDHYTDYMKAELKELIVNYHPAVLWFDGEWEDPWTHDRGVDLYAYLRALDPNLVINNRIDKARNGMAGWSDDAKAVGDFGTPEQQIPANGFGPGVDWESCMTLNDHWGYNSHDQNWKSPKTVVRNLIDIASKGGNYLLNVGPTSAGLIPDGSADCLAQVGNWTKVNGVAIYGTSASPFKAAPPWGRVTQSPARLYLFVFDEPADGKLRVSIANPVTRAYCLAEPGRDLATHSDSSGVEIDLGQTKPDPIAAVIALEIDGAARIASSP